MDKYIINHDYYKTEDDVLYKFMLDTCIFNKIYENLDLLNRMKKLKNKGHKYFVTRMQMRELEGMKDAGNRMIK